MKVLGIGTFLPSMHKVRDLAKAAGGPVEKFTGWEMTGVASETEHPSTMGLQVVTKALEQAGVAPGQLDFVISTGSTYDYPPSWSVALEVMKNIGAGSRCIGFDMSQGCVAAHTAIDLANSWLQKPGTAYAIVLCAQRWSYYIDRGDGRNPNLWAWGDGAGAILLGNDAATQKQVGKTGRSLTYLGATFMSQASLHGAIHRLHGGTRSPLAPEGKKPFEMEINSKIPLVTFFKVYRESYKQVIGEAVDRFKAKPDWVVCNHVAPGIVESIQELSGVDKEHMVQLGHEIGHVASADCIFDLERLLARPDVKPGDHVFAVGSGQHTFSCAVFRVG